MRKVLVGFMVLGLIASAASAAALCEGLLEYYTYDQGNPKLPSNGNNAYTILEDASIYASDLNPIDDPSLYTDEIQPLFGLEGALGWSYYHAGSNHGGFVNPGRWYYTGDFLKDDGSITPLTAYYIDAYYYCDYNCFGSYNYYTSNQGQWLRQSQLNGFENGFAIQMWCMIPEGDALPNVSVQLAWENFGQVETTHPYSAKPRFTSRSHTGTATLGGDHQVRVEGTNAALYNDGQWHHVVFTANYALQTFDLYVDGAWDAVDTFDQNWNFGAQNRCVTTGSNLPGHNSWQNWGAGQLDEVALWNRPLSAAEIGQLYARGTANLADPNTMLFGMTDFRAILTAPANGSTTDGIINVELQWLPDPNAASQAVKVGPSPGALVTVATVGGGASSQTVATAPGQTYYWGIETTRDTVGNWDGDVAMSTVWSFTTSAFVPCEGLRAYWPLEESNGGLPGPEHNVKQSTDDASIYSQILHGRNYVDLSNGAGEPWFGFEGAIGRAHCYAGSDHPNMAALGRFYYTGSYLLDSGVVDLVAYYCDCWQNGEYNYTSTRDINNGNFFEYPTLDFGWQDGVSFQAWQRWAEGDYPGEVNEWFWIEAALHCTSGNPYGSRHMQFNNMGGTFGPWHSFSINSVSTLLLDGNWHQMVGTGDPVADLVTLYIDGALSGTKTIDSSQWNLATNYTRYAGIGRVSAPRWATWGAGLIDEVAVWDRVLSADEVALLYARGAANMADPNTILYGFTDFRAALTAPADGSTLPASANGSVTLQWTPDPNAAVQEVMVGPNASSLAVVATLGGAASSHVQAVSVSSSYAWGVRTTRDTSGNWDGDTAMSEVWTFNTPPYWCVTPYPTGDINGDCAVDTTDLEAVIAQWLQTVPPANAALDLDGSGVIDLGDIGVIANNWLACTRNPSSTCP